VYFGNPSANESNDKDVWDEDFVLVNHLNEVLLDSTINNNNATNFGATETYGKIGNAKSFDGNSSYVVLGEDNLHKYFDANQSWTISVWANLSKYTNLGGIFFNRYADSELFGFYTRTSNDVMYTTRSSDSNSINGTPRSPTLNTWNYYVISRDFENTKINFGFNNINEQKTDNRIGDFISDTTKECPNCYFLGKMVWSYDFITWMYFQGLIDEVRISKIARSGEWIKTEYNNQSVPEEFIKIGVLEKSLISFP